VILYKNVTKQESEPLSTMDTILLQIGNLTIPPSSDWTLCISGLNHDDCFTTGASPLKSLLVSVPSIGTKYMRRSKTKTQPWNAIRHQSSLNLLGLIFSEMENENRTMSFYCRMLAR
jgi:hypothetical protein